jgi:hypothetical protein
MIGSAAFLYISPREKLTINRKKTLLIDKHKIIIPARRMGQGELGNSLRVHRGELLTSFSQFILIKI